MANPSKKAAPSYFAVKASIMAVSIACTLGGWGYLAKKQLDEEKMKQSEKFPASESYTAVETTSAPPAKLRKVVDIARSNIQMVPVNVKATPKPPVKNATSLLKMVDQQTSVAAQVVSQKVAVSPTATDPVRRKPVTRTRSSR